MKKLFTLLLTLFFTISLHANVLKLKLTPDNSLSLRDSFNAKSMTELKQNIIKMDANLKSGYPIYLVLYTPGGSIQEGLEFFEFTKGINRPIHTITIFAASMGFQAVQNLGERYILQFGTLMSHKARGGFEGEFGGGLSQLDSRYGMWLKRVNILDQITVDRSKGKQTIQSYRAAYDNELWLNGQEAVDKGYVDAIAHVSCDSLLTSQSSAQIFNLGFFRVKAVFSACPMLTSPISISGELLTNKGYMKVEDFLSKNGKFGKDCIEKDLKTYTDRWGNEIQGRKGSLCSYDKELTLDKIRKQVNNKKAFFNRNLRDNVEFSY